MVMYALFLCLQIEPMFNEAAAVNRHVLVYHRGVGVDATEGLFIMQKVSGLLHTFVLALVFAHCFFVCTSAG